MSYASGGMLGQASEQELEQIQKELAAKPAAAVGKDSGSAWLGVAALAAFILVVYTSRPRPPGARRGGFAEF